MQFVLTMHCKCSFTFQGPGCGEISDEMVTPCFQLAGGLVGSEFLYRCSLAAMQYWFGINAVFSRPVCLQDAKFLFDDQMCLFALPNGDGYVIQEFAARQVFIYLQQCTRVLVCSIVADFHVLSIF